MRLTQKQAREFVRDSKNWRVVQDGEYTRVLALDFGKLKYLDFVFKTVNHTAEFIGGSGCAEFDTHHYYSYSEKYSCAEWNKSKNEMAMEIWNEAKTL